MQDFFKEYWALLERLPSNPFLYILILLIASGGLTFWGKIVATIALILIVPIFQFMQQPPSAN